MLDMVRSMMSQTDLSLSFWGYAIETTAFKLNWVPTMIVERTSLWDMDGEMSQIVIPQSLEM
jgi:hypothetical protein